MPKASTLQSSFNSGELSPLMYGRTDSPRYKQGLATSLNYIPTLQGPNQRRPGTEFVANAKDGTFTLLVPFQFSITQAYMLEFGDEYIRFYANLGQVITTGTSFKVIGTVGVIGSSLGSASFYATRSSLTPQNPNEIITSSSSPSTGSILELFTPYRYQDLPNLRWVQSEDTLYLVHPSYPPYKLQRLDSQFWELTQIIFSDGPYLPINSYAKFADMNNVQFTVTSSNTGLGGIVYAISTNNFTVSGAVTDPASSHRIQITTSAAHNFVTGQNVFITGISGTTEANNYNGSGSQPVAWQIVVTSNTTFLLVASVFTNAYISGGTVFAAPWTFDIQAVINSSPVPDYCGTSLGRMIALIIGGVRYWGYYLNGLNAAEGQFIAGPGATAIPSGDIGAGVFTDGWFLGVWSNGLGFPSCATFHQDRLFFAGALNVPQEIDGSNVGNGNYQNFEPSDPTTLSVADDNALQFTLNSQSSNALRWLSSNAQGLLGGSYVAEWAMTPSSASEALTPTNFNAAQTSFYGSANAEAIQVGNASLYIQRAGRKIREMNFFFQVGTFRSTDLTELSEHITIPLVTKIVLQKETQPLIWGIRGDGNLVSMIYDRTDVSLQAGWTRHILGGQSDSSGTNPIVLSAAVIPSEDLSFDQVWLAVQRYINGQNVITIEAMTKIFDDSILQEDAFQGDCGATFYDPIAITAISIASTAVCTSLAHGFSNGDMIRIVGVTGLNKSTTDVNGNVTVTNLVNEKTFTVQGVTTNTFELFSNGNPVSSIGYGVYVISAFVLEGLAAKLVTTISGLTWLEGETVGVLTDGSTHPDCVVSSGGSITLQYPAAKVQIGYRFNSQGQLLRVEGGAADGTSIGKTRRTTRAAVQTHRLGDLSIGTSFKNLIPIQISQADQQLADQSTPLFSGIIREGLESAYDFESQICFQQNSMLPGAIESITSFMEEFDV